ncbi:fused signal recognition particle receptor [Maridesulfovibrio ferrireducens]|uniref:Signal recognition particle receptor FtsY n=1 Tax=Maridesulfovibrio ferrireducens TaxID=246191 RepID=A0A1G9JVL3_9BACT|nr:signal recognition particle-docking protein FtsY [Maridesulfovibrio ferrireducens]SDL41255.1 fused signal recognition particle receptor [Maridesulfovibrio ferrireducens]
MGFFSKVKKLWVSPEERAAKALKEYLGEADQPDQKIEPEAPAQQETPAPQKAVEFEPKAEVTPTPAPEPAPEPTQEPVSAPVVETVAVPESAGKARIIEPVMATEAKSDADKPQWQRDLTKALQQADPRLSVWLDLILDGIDTAGDDLWDRLTFLLKALEAPADEADDFVSRFKEWLDDMDYEHVDEFRSELQYRLALALELEDEEDERSRLFIKLSEGLSKTREQITKRLDALLSSHSAFDDDFWEEFEEILIMADVGFEATSELVERMKTRIRNSGETNPENFKDLLREELDEIFKLPKRIKAFNPPEVVMMIGVNGVGKTTTIAKIAHREQMQGRKVLIVAGDTFRAAAIGQLEIWAKRVGAGFFAKDEGSDPAAVAYEAIDYAVKNGYDLMLLDTAGRLHTKTNLMEELLKIRRVLGKKHDEAPHRSILVIDATTGQNAMSQTKLFNEAIGVDELILTKLDGTAKGGIMIAVTMQHKIPITFIGLGEKMEDLRPFNGADFAKALLM